VAYYFQILTTMHGQNYIKYVTKFGGSITSAAELRFLNPCAELKDGSCPSNGVHGHFL